MGRLFGTDGARGVAITELTCEIAMQIGRAAALVLTKSCNHAPRIFIGKDTRISSDVLEAALCAGICSVGATAVKLGVIPTPAVSYLVRAKQADAGVMISASHNSVEFNGIKLFAATGRKLPDAVEEEIESLILDHPETIALQDDVHVGRITTYPDAREDYISYLASRVKTNFSGLHIAIDCANGSASTTAESLFTRLGADVQMISNHPDGTNINLNCGSTHLENLSGYVKEHPCDVGLAFDGDADRCLAVDENGDWIDGDKIIAICATSMQAAGTLKKNTAVVTVMTNLGFFHFAKKSGIDVATTKVGDRYVLEKMMESGFNLGGEQSGHIIFLDDMTTGDGELSGLKLLEIFKHSGKKMSELASVMESYPQKLTSVRITPEKKGKWQDDAEVTSVIEMYTTRLGEMGRILVRESGTEPLIRIMAEGKDMTVIESAVTDITEKIQAFAQR